MKVSFKYIISSLFLLCLLGVFQQASAQFTINESFKGSVGPNIIVGDDAYLTSGVDDPVGAGWLRLTKDEGNQRGYAYINKSFPSTLGVLIDFEYTMWRSHEATYNGADGISIFLFDADYGPEADGTQFKLGAYGGSLGYANSTASSPTSDYGLMGAYLGVGLDAYGNFVRESEGKNGGSNNVSPNSIAIRGPQTNDKNTTTRYLEGVTVLSNDSIVNALNEQGNAKDNIVDYNTLTPTRPSNAEFYRRIQVEITPTNSGTYKITIRWKTSLTGSFKELMTYTTTDVPPDHLKVGFAASTGGGYNNQEVRNVQVTTPGNLRIVKKADKDILRSVNKGNDENEVTYTLNVVNDTKADLHKIEFEDQLTDANGNVIPSSMFNIGSISYSGFLPGTSLPTTSSDNQLTGSLNLAANTTATITVKGTLNAVPSGNVLNNTAKVTPTDIKDQDLGNNTSTVSIPVISEKSDLVISQTVDQPCLNTTTGNTFTINVSNMGSLNLGYSSSNPVKITGILPSGATISNTSNSGWIYNRSGNSFTFTSTGSGNLGTGISLPPISYTLVGSSSYTNSVSVRSNAEEPTNDGANNQSDYAIKLQPAAPTLPAGVISPIVYYVGEVAQPLSAEASNGNTLNWYLNPGGTPSSIPFTPSTTTAGTTSYWVSQTNGHCESNLTKIVVNVVDVPTISGTVFNDINGLIDNQIDDGSGVVGLSDLWVVAVDQSTNEVVEATAVNSFDGTYTLGLTNNGTYTLVLMNTSTPPGDGDSAPAASVPDSWENTGEYLGAGPGNDGTADGELQILNFTGSDITEANFGIRVMNPCSLPVQGNDFSWKYTRKPTGSTVSQTINQPAANGGFVFDIYALDNSFNMNINGTDLAVDELQFQSSGTPGPINVAFADGDQYETNTTDDQGNQANIWQMQGTAQNPLIRVKISATGAVTILGSKTSGGPLFPLVLTQGNSFNNIPWNATGSNTIIVTQVVTGTTSIDGYGYGLNIIDCNPVYAITKEGVFNDENGDGYAQVGETITYTITVNNNGNNAAHNIIVNDPRLGGVITATPTGDWNSDGVLDVFETWTYTVNYPVTQQDIANGGVYNQATVTGGNGVGDRFDPVESTDPTPLSPGDPHYDPNKENHTFVPLKGVPPVPTNPQLYNPAKDNGN